MAHARDRPGTQIYRVLAHDGGYAYAADGTVSETFLTHAEALAAAREAARRQTQPGADVSISFETPDGVWRTERAHGDDRPVTMTE